MSKNLHVAIIMDGNGRWAQSRKRARYWGHVRGSFNVSKITEEAVNQNFKALTLFAFSTENWGRPQKEVGVLKNLLRKFLKREKENIIKQNIRFNVIGKLSSLSSDTFNLVHQLKDETKMNTGMTLTLAYDYGARNEIVTAINRYVEYREKSDDPKNLTETEFEAYLDTHFLQDVDILIRTGGEYRVSNFLLWQIAYAELFFTSVMWPDFTPKLLNEAILEVSQRARRFGQVEEQKSFTGVKKYLENFKNNQSNY